MEPQRKLSVGLPVLVLALVPHQPSEGTSTLLAVISLAEMPVHCLCRSPPQGHDANWVLHYGGVQSDQSQACHVTYKSSDLPFRQEPKAVREDTEAHEQTKSASSVLKCAARVTPVAGQVKVKCMNTANVVLDSFLSFFWFFMAHLSPISPFHMHRC